MLDEFTFLSIYSTLLPTIEISLFLSRYLNCILNLSGLLISSASIRAIYLPFDILKALFRQRVIPILDLFLMILNFPYKLFF